MVIKRVIWNLNQWALNGLTQRGVKCLEWEILNKYFLTDLQKKYFSQFFTDNINFFDNNSWVLPLSLDIGGKLWVANLFCSVLSW